MELDQSLKGHPSPRVALLGLLICVILLFWEDVWDVLFGFSLLATEPRVTVWATCMLSKETASENHVMRPPPDPVVP